MQNVVNVTAAVLADMANSTVTLNDGAGQSVSVTLTNAPANIDALRDLLDAKITSHNGVGSNTDFGAVITDSLTGTDLEMTFSNAVATGKNVNMASLSYTKTASDLRLLSLRVT